MLKLDVSNYPRPDFVREDWQSLNGIWEFSFDTDVFDQKIKVPFVYQCTASGIGVTKDHEIVWYRRTFEVDKDKLEGKRLLIKFGAVDYEAEVFINGQFVGNHKGGHTSFSFDITNHVNAGENEIRVKVRDGLEVDKPRGKQSWIGEPFSCWYTPTTGIWQEVWLEYTGEVYIERIKITPDLKENKALYEFFISDNRECKLHVSTVADSIVLNKQYNLGENIFTCSNGYGKCMLAFPDLDHMREQLIWSVEKPNLIYVQVTLTDEKENVDTVQTYFGMRSAELTNHRFYLNGNACMQRLILDQGYWKDTLLTPPDKEAIIEDIRLTKAMGFNGVRKHQKIEDPRYYYFADKMGLLVWGELPSSYMYNDNTVKNSANEMMEFLERDFNHPCIVTWVPLNESWGVRNIRTNEQQQAFSDMLIFLLKAFDPTRAVSGNDGWEQTSNTDIMTLHDYELMPFTTNRYDDMENMIQGAKEPRPSLAKNQKYQGQPIMMTEYGGVAFEAESNGWGYHGKVRTEKDFLDRIAPITEYMIKSGKFAGFCYTQLTDVMQEKNGLLDENRNPKIPVEKLKEIFAKEYYQE